MATLPGFYAAVELGKGTVVPGGPKLNTASLNFAIVMNEDDDPVPQRYSTWGMATDAAVLYQANNQPNQIIMGDAGKIYLLEETRHLDDGKPILNVWQSGPLPEPEPGNGLVAISQKRIHEFWWQIAEEPPAGGYDVTLNFIDIDDPGNPLVTSSGEIVRRVTQTTRKQRIQVGLRCRQFKVRISVTTDRDYCITSWGIKGQQLERPYTRKS